MKEKRQRPREEERKRVTDRERGGDWEDVATGNVNYMDHSLPSVSKTCFISGKLHTSMQLTLTC